MDKPDRDYAKTVHAEEEYRTMLQQFPDSVLVPDAKQRLREVQEVLGTREASIAAFYATHNNWAATIARYQTVADTYPQYSHMDDVLIGLGDAYSAEGRFVRNMKLPEAAKARLEKLYDDQAAAAYTKVATVYAASPHVEDARDRLEAMGQPIPKPTAEQLAASEKLENSRAQYRLTDRARLLILHQPDVVTAARVGEPTLADPKPTIAPDVTRKSQAEFMAALNPNAKPAAAATNSAPSSDAGSAPAEAAPASTAPAAPLALSDVGTGDTGSTGSTSSVVTAAPSTNSGSGASAGIEIVSPGSAPAATPAATPNVAPGSIPDPNGGLKAVGPTNNTPLPAIEKPEVAPDQVNDLADHTAPPAAAQPAKGKKAKPGFDKDDESSSKHKKKKGLNKINPF